MKKYRVLAINPGATSTKLGVYEDEECLWKENLEHPHQELLRYEKSTDQFEYRLGKILEALAVRGFSLEDFDAVVGRGGPIKPVPGGTFEVNEKLLDDLRHHARVDHPSVLGGILAHELAKERKIPSFIVDPVSVDEFEPVARVSGLKGMERQSLWHALNSRAAAHSIARKLGRPYRELNLIVVHLGSGISVSAHRRGRVVDVNMPNEEGPFSPERCGGLPANQLVKLCFSGKYTQKEIIDRLIKKGGVFSYKGTKDMRELERMMDDGDEEARLLYEAMAYQVAKEVGAMATVLEGEVDRIVITGGIAYSKRFVGLIKQRVDFLARTEVLPGEEELEALSQGALRVLRGEEEAKTYQ